MLRKWLRELKELRRNANYERADFDPFKRVKSTTEMVRSVTKNYRDAWVTGPIDRIIADIEHYLGDEP